jgi:hypothetical protein
MIGRCGDPKLLLEIDMLTKLFRVFPLTKVHHYNVVDFKETFMTLKKYLSMIDSKMSECCDENESFFDDKIPERVEVTTKAFVCILRSMGLVYDPVSGAVKEDDIAKDYGYGAGAAVKWRRSAWGNGWVDPRKTCDEAVATRAVMLVMMAMASIDRADLTLELMTRLVSDKYETEVTLASGFELCMQNPWKDQSPKARVCHDCGLACTYCFSKDETASIFARVALTVGSLIVKSGSCRTKSAQRQGQLPGDDRCACGLSPVYFRIQTSSSSRAPIFEVKACPLFVASHLGRNVPCKSWSVRKM